MTLRPLPTALLLALTLAPAIARADVPPPGGGSSGLSTGGCSVEQEEQRLGEACEECASDYVDEANGCSARFDGTDFDFVCRTPAGREVWCEEGGGCSFAPPRDAVPPLGVAAPGLAAAAAWLIRRHRRPAG